jgi:ankyrin repeat protein
MQVSINLTSAEIAEVQQRYSYLTNYSADDPTDPIDPLTYVDSNGDHLLHIAASAGDVSTVELLLRAGIDVDQQGDMGCTALHYAKLKGREDVARVLLDHGASQSLRNSFGRLPGER